MPILSAENNYRRGLAALVDDNHSDALVFFHRAIEIDGQRSAGPPKARYLSYYGFCLAKTRGWSIDSIETCERAASREPADPELLVNLGRVYLMAGRKSLALAAFERGLALAPDHPVLLRELGRVDRRNSPVLGNLDRDHPLNRLFGRMRASIRHHGADWVQTGAARTPH